MKKINELTEEEILALNDEDIELMIKLVKAQEGIKLTPRPKEPDYFKIAEPDKVVYSCPLFGDDLVFENIEELNDTVKFILKAASKGQLKYDYNKLGSDYKYMSVELEKPYGADWHSTNSHRVYSIELYNQIVDAATQNKKLKEQYGKELKEYETIIESAKWIETEIMDKVSEVREKFWKLESLCRKFKYDYMPLSNNNESVAMAFLDKAYSLTEEQKSYVISHYVEIK